MIYVSSFFDQGELPEDHERLSVAVYQPKGFKYPKIEWADIRERDGTWIRPRLFIKEDNPLRAYWDAIMDHYSKRHADVEDWYWNYATDKMILCCWCPHDKAARRQIAEFGSFICHTGPLAQYLEETMGMEVIYDRARIEQLAHP